MSVHDKTDSSTSSSGSAKQFRARKSDALLRHIEAELLAVCNPLMQQMYSSTEDLFYDLSKRATSNNEQNLYFESMREIRIKKDVLIQGFIEGLKQNFARILSNKLNVDTPDKSTTFAVQDLAIVERDDLEIEIATKNMTDRTCELFKREIHEFAVRLEFLYPGIKISSRNNPLAPQLISFAFANACFSSLKINTKARLILFKVFEKNVLKQLDKAYSSANQHLIEAGVLTKIPKTVKKQALVESQKSTTKPHSETQHQLINKKDVAQTGAISSTISISPGLLTSLMSAVKNSEIIGIHYHIYCANPGPVLAIGDLTNGLSKKQPLIDKKIAKAQPKNYLPTLINELLSKGSEQSPRALQQNEEHTINLIALFVDKILEDKKLSMVAQSLICRLQIPLLKLALNDTTFLTQPDHPARNLINSITKASAQLDSSKALERDPLYRLIVDGIQTINHQYAASPESFELLSNEIEQQLQMELRKSTIIEKRTEQTEIGKAKIKSAKSLAQLAVYDKIKDQKLPLTVMDFLVDAWLQVLLLTCLKESKESVRWVETEHLIADLIWLCKPKEDERSKTRAYRLIPDILNKIDQSLSATINDHYVKQQHLTSLESILFSIANNEFSDQLHCISDKQLNLLGRETPAPQNAWDEEGITDQTDQHQTPFKELTNEQFMLAKDMTEGTWLEYTGDDNKILLCKLSKRIDADNYIFVNRFGIKTLEKTRRDLAYDLQSNNAKILDITPLFDRVLDDIITQFKVEAA